jgi:hypothetical protein
MVKSKADRFVLAGPTVIANVAHDRLVDRGQAACFRPTPAQRTVDRPGRYRGHEFAFGIGPLVVFGRPPIQRPRGAISAISS